MDLGREFCRDNENFDDLHSTHAETLKQNLLLLLQKYYVKGSLRVMECLVTGILQSTVWSIEIVSRGGPPLKMGGPPLAFINQRGGPPLDFINQMGVRL